MKRVFILCAALLCGGIAQAQYQLYNPGFESWEGTSLTAKPSNWSSFPQADGTWASFASTAQHYHRNGGRPGTSGSSFVTIYTRSVLGTKANGNMTTGQIHAGSTSASSSDNYNYTHRGSNYCHAFSGTPDSMYVWVSFYAASSSSTGMVKAYIHGDNDFRSPNHESDASKYCGKAISTFTRTTSNASSRQWVQKKVPFVYDGFSSVNYILMSISTNTTPGGGAANDSLSIDDIEFIYSAWLDNISINWDSIPTFQRGILDYADTLPTYDLLCSSTIQFSTQAADATVTVDTLWLDSHTRRFVLHVVAEDTVTTRDYTVTLVGPEPPCDTVSGLAAQVFVNTAALSWTAGTNNSAYEVEYGMEGFTLGTGTTLSTLQTAATLEGLDYGTTYQAYVRAICRDTVYTEWSSPVTFTTDTLPVIECPAVDSLVIDTLGLSFATVHWSFPAVDSSDSAALFHVVLMSGDETLATIDTRDTLFSVDTLMPGTAYILSVATVCDSSRQSVPRILAFATLPDTVGIRQFSILNSQFSIFPNPASDMLTVESAEAMTALRVVNALGQEVYSLTLPLGTRHEIDIRRWPRGIYLLTAETAGGTATERVVIR